MAQNLRFAHSFCRLNLRQLGGMWDNGQSPQGCRKSCRIQPPRGSRSSLENNNVYSYTPSQPFQIAWRWLEGMRRPSSLPRRRYHCTRSTRRRKCGKVFVYNQEAGIGSNAFHSLSLRLAACGDLNGALPNAKRATELFRDLVALAPRHLPALARSLQNMASILWKFDRRDESVAACAEAVSILRKVVDPETYFLPALAEALDQLVTYRKVTGDVNGASAAAIEWAEVVKKSASLPCQPEFLLDETEVDSDDEDDEVGWETASEGADENLADTSLEVVLRRLAE
ncbi:hypothetical protein B0H16DRAFT_843532 [Mycena metata]|uniref:Uncharacterized protein n=1 Tax=Mycena metata TaxID=1033252 RepID=A0AAD7DNQ0_9AGAR|nr:hypothetical protein B0H16DRAFT_843532 [Mycena metata]